ncbi:MAG: glycosyltransferase family 2 protein [Candidatus Saccharimonadales bacterium]
MPSAKKPFVSVGIPTLGRGQILLNTIHMVLAQGYELFEVIVADQSLEHNKKFLAKLKGLKTDRRLRYFFVAPKSLPAARNFILKKAKGELIIFIDDDVQLKKDFISTHVHEHLRHPEVSVIAGRVEQKGLPLSDSPLYFNKYGLPQGTFNCPNSGPCEDFPGGNHSVRTSVLKKIGGYHTAYKKDAVREESDTSHRLHEAGFNMFYSAEASAVHLSVGHGGSRIYKVQFDSLRFYINDLLFMLRTVRLRYLPISIFKRARIYTGGPFGRRFKRAGIFLAGFITALWLLIFERKSYPAREVRGR